MLYHIIRLTFPGGYMLEAAAVFLVGLGVFLIVRPKNKYKGFGEVIIDPQDTHVNREDLAMISENFPDHKPIPDVILNPDE